MSNDDLPDSFVNFINTVQPDNKPYLIVALCPNFINPEAKNDFILKILINNGYNIYF
jgi:hypothetical protein